MADIPIQRALISVSNKTGIEDLARALARQGVEIIATGGTHKRLVQAGVAAIEVSVYTGFPEIMDGRVKTLHPKIHGGLLGRRQDKAEDKAVMSDMGIPGIDLAVINLYPFRETISQPDVHLAEAIENIDIGGPAMLRAAAKNHANVLVVTNPEDYSLVIEAVKTGVLDEQTRLQLAAKAFQHTASYDGAIANYLGGLDANEGGLGRHFNCTLERIQSLRYGENPHQKAALYSTLPRKGLAAAKQWQGKPLSYNNINDADTAWQLVCSFTQPSCVIVKHANPCGVASAEDALTAYQAAYETDAVSAFGGIIAFNCSLSAEAIATIAKQQFAEVIIAPAVEGDTETALKQRKNIRLLTADILGTATELEVHSIAGGGLLVQERDRHNLDESGLRVVTERPPTEAEHQSLGFAWTVARFVKSNAMVLASGMRTIGVGAGQMSRVYSTRIAAMKARDEGLETKNTVLASDAFLPFRDGLDEAARIGVTALIQPGGSIRDQEVIDAANEAGMAMLFTGIRHFRH